MSGGTRARPHWLLALGAEDLPPAIEVAGGTYVHERTYKHDFFAATGLYSSPTDRVVLKVGRTRPVLGLPLAWLGRWLRDRELVHYRVAEDLPGVPHCLGPHGPTGFVHAFVEGHPLQREEHVDDEFFPRLRELLDALHGRRLAYADLEKRENILVGDDGRPALIDFQISWYWPEERDERSPLSRWIPGGLGLLILDRLCTSDLYHLGKHRRRHRRDLMSEEEIAASYRIPGSIRWHRWMMMPFQWVRRSILRVVTGRWRSPKQDGPEFLR